MFSEVPPGVLPATSSAASRVRAEVVAAVAAPSGRGPSWFRAIPPPDDVMPDELMPVEVVPEEDMPDDKPERGRGAVAPLMPAEPAIPPAMPRLRPARSRSPLRESRPVRSAPCRPKSR